MQTFSVVFSDELLVGDDLDRVVMIEPSVEPSCSVVIGPHQWPAGRGTAG